MSTTNKIVGTSAILIGIILIYLLIKVVLHMFNHEARSTNMIEGPHISSHTKYLEITNINIRHSKYSIDKKQVSRANLTKEDLRVNISGTDDYFEFTPLTKIEVPHSTYKDNGVTIVLSDIEGDFDYFKNMLVGNHVIDSQYNWIFGAGRLVLDGDIFDRGDKVTECLWLIYKLEKEAIEAGGRVHFILGNHELMVLTGDYRYVHRKYKHLTHALNIEYNEMFSNQTELGRWVRSKNIMEIIGRTLYVHGGISPGFAERGLSIQQANSSMRQLMKEDKLNLRTETGDVLWNSEGPLWYRGYFDQDLETSDIDRILDTYNVDHIVVGHTVVPHIKGLFDNRIVAIDMKRKHENDQFGLLIENGTFYIIDHLGNKSKL